VQVPLSLLNWPATQATQAMAGANHPKPAAHTHEPSALWPPAKPLPAVDGQQTSAHPGWLFDVQPGAQAPVSGWRQWPPEHVQKPPQEEGQWSQRPWQSEDCEHVPAPHAKQPLATPTACALLFRLPTAQAVHTRAPLAE